MLVPIGVGLAVVLSAAALVVALLRGGQESARPMAAPQENMELPEMLVDGPDRELCLAIGPLMVESQDTRKTFQAVGPKNSPERRAAIPRFKSDVDDWAQRMQQTINQHEEPPRYLTRIIQRYIDDMTIYVVTLSPEREASSYETPIYDLTIIDFSGIMGRCFDVGAPWWR